MKKRPARKLLAAVALVLACPVALVAVASAPAPPRRAEAPPRIEVVARGKGPLTAGAAAVPIELPPGTPIAGFARLSYQAGGVRDPVSVRAVVIGAPGCRIALVSAELLLVPEELEEAVRARISDVPLDGLVLAATHTHAGPGGFWDGLAVERIGAAPFDPAVRDAIAHAIATAIRGAVAAEAPARLSVARARAGELARNRTGRAVDARLVVLRLERPDATPVAELAMFPAHPTILGMRNRAISGDWGSPFLAVATHGVRLLFQGALGDQSIALPTDRTVTPELYAAALSTAVDGLAFGAADAAPALAYARAQVTLPAVAPAAVPGPLQRAVRNLAADALPAHADVAALRLGPVLLVAVPGEPTAEVGARLRERAGPGAEILSLANGYVGYVETAAAMKDGAGESKRTYYGPELAARLERGAAAAADAVRGEARGASGSVRPAGALAVPAHAR